MSARSATAASSSPLPLIESHGSADSKERIRADRNRSDYGPTSSGMEVGRRDGRRGSSPGWILTARSRRSRPAIQDHLERAVAEGGHPRAVDPPPAAAVARRITARHANRQPQRREHGPHPLPRPARPPRPPSPDGNPAVVHLDREQPTAATATRQRRSGIQVRGPAAGGRRRDDPRLRAPAADGLRASAAHR